MNIETIEQQVAACRAEFDACESKLANLEAELAALKKPAEVKYRPAEWPRDWNRADAEFCDDGGDWIPAGPLAGMAPDQFAEEFSTWLAWNSEDYEEECEWFDKCRVPILEGETPGYREPVLPGDRMAAAEFSFDGVEWVDGRLCSYACQDNRPWCDGMRCYKFARIRTGATE
jgi:hypothetical protein